MKLFLTLVFGPLIVGGIIIYINNPVPKYNSPVAESFHGAIVPKYSKKAASADSEKLHYSQSIGTGALINERIKYELINQKGSISLVQLTIDSCEYIYYKRFQEVALVHKGNCRNHTKHKVDYAQVK